MRMQVRRTLHLKTAVGEHKFQHFPVFFKVFIRPLNAQERHPRLSSLFTPSTNGALWIPRPLQCLPVPELFAAPVCHRRTQPSLPSLCTALPDEPLWGCPRDCSCRGWKKSPYQITPGTLEANSLHIQPFGVHLLNILQRTRCGTFFAKQDPDYSKQPVYTMPDPTTNFCSFQDSITNWCMLVWRPMLWALEVLVVTINTT